MFTKIFVVRIWFNNWFCETLCGGEVTVLLTYFMDDITETFK
jgi:hypothetical protein